MSAVIAHASDAGKLNFFPPPDPWLWLTFIGTGITIAGYTLVDGLGVRASGDAFSYIVWLNIVEGPWVLLVAIWQRGSGKRHDRPKPLDCLLPEELRSTTRLGNARMTLADGTRRSTRAAPMASSSRRARQPRSGLRPTRRP